MANPNLIACLYPEHDIPGLDNALRTVYMPENASRCFGPLVAAPDRHSSPSSDGDGDGDSDSVDGGGVASHDYSPGLQLRFDDWRKNRLGFVLGTSPDCDIVLPKSGSLAGIAPRHCAITFDDRGRLMLQDLQDPPKKPGGIAVIYGNVGGQKCGDSTWILSGDHFATRNTPIVITLHRNLKFKIVVAHHDTYSAQYREKVAQFAARVVDNAADDGPTPHGSVSHH